MRLIQLQNIVSTCLLVIPIGFGSGCSSTSVFTSYPSQLKTPRSQIAANQPEKAYQSLSTHLKSNDGSLYAQECGRIASLQNQFELSNQCYQQAINVMYANQLKPTVSVKELLNATGSLVGNDNSIPYEGASYELVFDCTFKALNYLAQGRISDALVEVRRADEEQHYALSVHEKELQQLSKDIRSQSLNTNTLQNQLSSATAEMQSITGTLENSFQNAYTYYISGLLYELSNKLNDAYIDYKKASNLAASNTYCRICVDRLGKVLNMPDSGASIQIAPVSSDGIGTPNGSGRLVILYETGLVAEKTQIKVPIPINDKVFTIAMPLYSKGIDMYPDPSLKVLENGSVMCTTELLCSVKTMAAKALLERYTGILVRQIGRLIIKGAVQNELNRSDIFLGLGFGIINAFIENADLRSWLTLPSSIHIAECTLPPGPHTLQLNAGNGSNSLQSITIQPNQIHILHVVTIGSSFYAWGYPNNSFFQVNKPRPSALQ